ncbi:MAG TPA: sulfurtransferase TusA family protein [Alcanivoracaceae bacterium]|nr:sulfurtransferase TusA family protein [Alcanivoracaceae bacterium]
MESGWHAEQTLDARGLLCPMPLLRTRQALRRMVAGQLLLVKTTDPGAHRDIPAYLRQASHELVRFAEQQQELWFLIRVGAE